eukprot:CRZ05055.1 hypothetical protein [Spongospora subterranea]
MEYSRSTLFPTASARCGRLIDQQITIVDLNGLNSSHISKNVYQYIKSCAEIDQKYYPEALNRMFVVNAPFLFSAIWRVIKPWVEPRTSEKISITRNGNEDELLKIIDRDCLPDFLGGSDTTFLHSEHEAELRRCSMGERPLGSQKERLRFALRDAT